MKKIGIMGGTFDPIHIGHIKLGIQAYEEYQLDEIWYMPTRQPPHKKDHLITASLDRYTMIVLAISTYPFMKASDFELKRTGSDTYTAVTLKLLNEEYPQDCFYFIMGADSLLDIEGWYHPKEIMDLSRILVAGREVEDQSKDLMLQIAYLKDTYQAKIEVLHCPNIDISSEEIRRDPGSFKHYLNPQVYQYIIDHKLYIS